MNILFIKHFFVGFMVSEIPRVSVFGHCPYSVTFPYICGDYNINLINNTVLSISLKNILIQSGVSNIIDMPTRITHNSQ